MSFHGFKFIDRFGQQLIILANIQFIIETWIIQLYFIVLSSPH